MEWSVMPLEEFVDVNPRVQIPKGKQCEFVEMADIAPGHRYVMHSTIRAAGGSGSKFVNGDTLMARITPCLENGKIAQFKSGSHEAAFGSTEFWVFRAKQDLSDPAFVFYLATSSIIRGPAEKSMAGASGRQRADIEAVRELQVPAPPLTEQRRIASILSAYDDLIENNTRRIAILEEMARRIYEEWFVHFRFPGHERVRMVESELGSVPEGWATGSFTELADVLSGGTPKKSDPAFWGGPIPFFTPKDAPRFAYVITTEAHITDAGLKHCASRLYPKDTVFITARGTVGKLALNSCDMAMNQSCYALKARGGYGQIFLFFATQAVVEELRTKSHGAVFDTIIMDTFRLMEVALPPAALAARFESMVGSMLALSLSLQKSNANLRTTRDLLLPKLISGELDISALPEPEAVAA